MPQYEIDEADMPSPIGGMTKQELHFHAYDVAQNYTFSNPYMDDRQKVIIEVWARLPINGFGLTYLLSSFIPIGIKPVFVAIYVSLLLGWFVTLAKESFLEKMLPWFNPIGNVLLFAGLTTVAFGIGNISLISAIGVIVCRLCGIFSAGDVISHTWAVSKYPLLNPRYGASKELFNIELPFEKNLSKDPEIVPNGELLVLRQKVLALLCTFLLSFATVVWAFQ